MNKATYDLLQIPIVVATITLLTQTALQVIVSNINTRKLRKQKSAEMKLLKRNSDIEKTIEVLYSSHISMIKISSLMSDNLIGLIDSLLDISKLQSLEKFDEIYDNFFEPLSQSEFIIADIEYVHTKFYDDDDSNLYLQALGESISGSNALYFESVEKLFNYREEIHEIIEANSGDFENVDLEMDPLLDEISKYRQKLKQDFVNKDNEINKLIRSSYVHFGKLI